MALVYMDGDGVGDTEPHRSQQHGGGHYNGEGGAIQKGNELVGTAEKGHDENAGEQDIDQPAFFYAEVEHERQFNGHQEQDKTGNDERAQQRCGRDGGGLYQTRHQLGGSGQHRNSQHQKNT